MDITVVNTMVMAFVFPVSRNNGRFRRFTVCFAFCPLLCLRRTFEHKLNVQGLNAAGESLE